MKWSIKIGLSVAVDALVLFALAVVAVLAYVSPPEDDISPCDYPSEFFCINVENRINRQTDGQCAAYAAAYLLRHFGENVNGEELTSEIRRTFGFVSAGSIAAAFVRRGYWAKPYCGNVDTLKQQLANGDPILVFVRIPGDTHYAVVVGYDEQFIYLADSLEENSGTSDARYNRILTTEDFKTIWKTGGMLPDNIYIVVRTAGESYA